MKKLFFALALTTFVGSMASTAYAAENNISVEHKNDDKKKKKKRGSCASKSATTTGSCSKPAEGKACCSKK